MEREGARERGSEKGRKGERKKKIERRDKDLRKGTLFIQPATRQGATKQFCPPPPARRSTPPPGAWRRAGSGPPGGTRRAARAVRPAPSYSAVGRRGRGEGWGGGCPASAVRPVTAQCAPDGNPSLGGRHVQECRRVGRAEGAGGVSQRPGHEIAGTR